MHSAWDRLLAVMDEVSAMHLMNSEKMKMSETLIKSTAKDLETLNQQNYKIIHKGANELEKKVHFMERLEKEYEKHMKEVDKITATYRNTLSEYAEAKKKAELMEKMHEECVSVGKPIKNIDKEYLKSIKDVENGKSKVEKV
jgi:predicted RNase H-like nuclease (RuvC/YqgF family)